ncbi:SMI1/KNR4 family protein [Streptomyces sp. NPDC006368]|uniref:SMI1/KNR4 family protein n=1 Tax=Streptomyces sp. NPDC006368 TaxID=3156760 RepID=UPI0033AE64A5
MNPFDALTRLCPPPLAPRPVTWSPVEHALGTRLPNDYKQLIETYGGGIFDETIWVLEPDCVDEDYDLVAQTRECADVLAELWSTGEPKPAELHPAGARAIPWAYVEGSGHFLYWLALPGRSASEWTVLLNEGRGPEWEHHHVSCTEFLAGLMTGEVQSSYLPDFYAEDHVFEPYADVWPTESS